jgi:pantoate kinase
MRLLIPHHVTGFWLPRYAEDPLTTGSLGAGLLLDYAVASLETAASTTTASTSAGVPALRSARRIPWATATRAPPW